MTEEMSRVYTKDAGAIAVLARIIITSESAWERKGRISFNSLFTKLLSVLASAQSPSRCS
jgi:hypothetical protein